MSRLLRTAPIMWVGDEAGRNVVYDASGNLILAESEDVLRVATGCDVTVYTPWRRVLPRVLFLGFNKPTQSKLYVTSERIVLIREIDSWRQLRGEMTPLGFPNAIATKVELDRMSGAGTRQFCQIRPYAFRLVRVRRSRRPGAWLGLRLVGNDGLRYAVSIWKTNGEDIETLSMVEARFQT